MNLKIPSLSLEPLVKLRHPGPDLLLGERPQTPLPQLHLSTENELQDTAYGQ